VCDAAHINGRLDFVRFTARMAIRSVTHPFRPEMIAGKDIE
jgi:hypothetical protein